MFDPAWRGAAMSGAATVLVMALGLAVPAVAQDLILPPVIVTAPSPVLPTGTGGGYGAGSAAPGLLNVATDTFAPVTIVTRDEIARNHNRTLGDALFAKPGVTSATYAPGASRPVVRGLDNFRVRVQENGIGSLDASTIGEDHGVPIDPNAVDRIEVIRGPATLRFGSQAIGGVVSAENNRIPQFIPAGGLSASTTGGVTSVDHGYSTGTRIDAGAGNFAVHVDAFRQQGDDYRTPRGVERNSAFESQGAAFGTSYVFENGYVGVAYSRFDSLYAIPGGEAAANRTRIDLKQDKVISKGEWRPGSDGIAAVRYWFGAANYRHDEISRGDDGFDAIGATFKAQEQEGRVEIQHTPFATGLGLLSGAIGVQLGHADLGTSGEAGSLIAPTDTKSIAGYVFEELGLNETLKLQGAARVESVRVGGTASDFPQDFLPAEGDPAERPASRSFTPASASLGLLQDLPHGFVASLNGQYVERAPAAAELFSRGVHEATATFEIGDPNVKIEAARTVEVGIRRALGPIRFDATGYYTRYAGFIFKRLTGVRCGEAFSTCGVEDELTQIVYAQRDATFYGAEIATQVDLIPVNALFGEGFFGVDAQFDTVRAKFSDGADVPRIPPARVGGGIFWRAEGWFARVGLLHAFAQTNIADGETPTRGYDLVRAELSYTRRLDPVNFGLAEITLGVVGENLLDDEIRNHVSFKKDEILLPGRNLRAFATVRF